MDGFVIVQPGAPRDFLFHTFGRTAGEAWMRFLGYNQDRVEKHEYPTLRQRAMSKGFRVARATLTVEPRP